MLTSVDVKFIIDSASFSGNLADKGLLRSAKYSIQQMLSVELTSRCSCYVSETSTMSARQFRHFVLVPRFPGSTVQYDGSI